MEVKYEDRSRPIYENNATSYPPQASLKAAVVGKRGLYNDYRALGGFFEGIMVSGGLHITTKIIKVTAHFKELFEGQIKDYHMDSKDSFVITAASHNFSLYLPKDPHPGRIIIIKRTGASPKVFISNGSIFTNSRRDFVEMDSGESKTFIYADMWHTMS